MAALLVQYDGTEDAAVRRLATSPIRRERDLTKVRVNLVGFLEDLPD